MEDKTVTESEVIGEGLNNINCGGPTEEDIEFEDRNINEVDEVDRSGGVEEEGVLPSVERDDEADISRGDEDVEWLLMVFENSKQFKSALTRYTIVKRFDFKLAKNEKDKARVVCKGEACPFTIYAFIDFRDDWYKELTEAVASVLLDVA
ncbi:hypothetical protein V6N13_109423 [Hibiscus sabdariffa]